MELGWIRDNDLTVGPSDYLRMTLKKTCWYSFIHPCRIGALIAGRPGANLDAFNAFGFFLGPPSRFATIVLNLVGSRDRYGKEILGDIYEGKRTLMLTRLAGLVDQSEQARLSRLLGTPRNQRGQREVAWVFDAMERHDCVAYARRAAARLVEGAREAFPTAFAGASGVDRDFVAHCLDYMTQRTLSAPRAVASANLGLERHGEGFVAGRRNRSGIEARPSVGRRQHGHGYLGGSASRERDGRRADPNQFRGDA